LPGKFYYPLAGYVNPPKTHHLSFGNLESRVEKYFTFRDHKRTLKISANNQVNQHSTGRTLECRIKEHEHCLAKYTRYDVEQQKNKWTGNELPAWKNKTSNLI
jgi:hypothetical protein